MKAHHVVPRILAALYALTLFPACAELDGDPANADPAGELGIAVSDLTYNAPHVRADSGSELIQVAGGLFNGFTLDRVVGGLCSPGMNRLLVQVWSDFASVSGAWSTWTWQSPVPNSEGDCSAKISMSVPSGGHWDNFHWRIYQLPYNLAHTPVATASQSSTAFGGVPWRANDGNTDGNWANNSVSHTDFDSNAWWQVNLGAQYPIGTVLVYNRTDCCSDRLSDFDVLVSSDGASWTPIGGITGAAPNPSGFGGSGTGQFVRVRLRGTNYLHLAEVQVYVP
jgi:hypothetical protein